MSAALTAALPGSRRERRTPRTSSRGPLAGTAHRSHREKASASRGTSRIARREDFRTQDSRGGCPPPPDVRPLRGRRSGELFPRCFLRFVCSSNLRLLQITGSKYTRVFAE